MSTATLSDVPDDRSALRRQIYWVLIALSAGAMIGRVLAVNSVDKAALEVVRAREGRRDWQLQRPFLSGNDRSRWCTIRALVEQGTYAIDDIQTQPGWDTIDMVKHDGRLYSSKPPLLPTLLAGPYWIVYQTTGATLATHPYAIGRGMLLLVQVLPLLIYFALLARIVERYGTTDWGRIFVVATAVFGTFLTTFAVTLNNHVIAAACAMAAIYPALRIVYDGERRLRYFAWAGFFAAFTAANELPALAFLAAVAAGLLLTAWRPTLVAFAPAAIVVAAGFFGTNYAAHGSLIPAYAHRGDGEGENWYEYTYERGGRTRDSYWKNRQGIDQGEASPALYAVHVLIGHHGIFSLTPVWLLTLVGFVLACRPGTALRQLTLLTALVSLACVTFYLSRPLIDRNYGGMTSGMRWFFWLAPLWLLAMLPAADWFASRRWARGVALVALALSVLAASYPTWNPWTHPWLLDWFLHLGWTRFS